MHKIKYTSYRQGAIVEVEIEDSTWEQLGKGLSRSRSPL